jgi:hypothetical protein
MVEVVVSAGPGHDIRLRVAETLRKRHRLERKLLLTSIPFQAAILALAAWLAWSGTGALHAMPTRSRGSWPARGRIRWHRWSPRRRHRANCGRR